MAFCEQHTYAPHVVYALLSGRLLIVHGSPQQEDAVRALIKALWLFVPGASAREQVVPWREREPLTLADLGRLKLLGLSKRLAVPKTLQRCVSGRFLE
jgi:hypothetical protein